MIAFFAHPELALMISGVPFCRLIGKFALPFLIFRFSLTSAPFADKILFMNDLIFESKTYSAAKLKIVFVFSTILARMVAFST